MTADLLLRNGLILTLNDARPECSAMATRDGRVVALGSDCGGLAGPSTREVDLAGRTVIPGLTDAHCHLVQYGLAERREADLRGSGSVAEVLSRLARHARKRRLSDDGDTWLLGRSFDQDRLDERRWPTRADLDGLQWRGPVCLTRVCGHARVVNSRAQEVIRHSHPNFDARITGLYTEDEMGPIFDAIPAPGEGNYLEAARWATQDAARAGFTTVHCLVGGTAEIRALVQLRAEGALGCRIRVQLPYHLLDRLDELPVPRDDEWLSLGNVKLFADGSLGARTAALSQPYHDDPSTAGELLMTAEEIAACVVRVWRAGLQPCVHAIGDLAVDTVAAAYEHALAQCPEAAGVKGRPRIEHVSLVSPDTVAKLARLQIACCVQPQFVRSDWWTEERLGPERVRSAYPLRDLLDAGVPLLGGTDCPVEKLEALTALACAVARPGEEWARRFGQELTADEALRVFATAAAEALGEASGAGTLSPGSRADFLVLGDDPRAVANLEQLPVKQVWVGGEERPGEG
jgi:predicted amidohydrolase YtcJ